MTMLARTTLLGAQWPVTGIPNEDIEGTLHSENGGISFYDNRNSRILFVPFENISFCEPGQGHFQRGLRSEPTIGTLSQMFTIGLYDPTKLTCVCFHYTDTRLGERMNIYFLVTTGNHDKKQAHKLSSKIQEVKGSYLDGLRNATRPK